MPQVEELKIFLASPSDVAKERSYVQDVIDEINGTIAPSKGVFLRVVSSKDTFPGYDQDGQSVLNKQIGTMKEYEIFLGIMWSRVGTPTPRAESGTIEEFKRAVRANNRHDKPLIWFYFRQSATQLNTEEELEQRRKVVIFKKEIQWKALTHDYKNPSNFRDLFRKNISLWLNKLPNKTSRPSISAAKRNKRSSMAPTNSQPLTTKKEQQRESSSTSTAADNKRKSSSTSLTKKRSLAGSCSKAPATRNINSSGAWVMLNDNFFLTKCVETQANQTVIINISPANPDQEASLRKLQPDQHYKKKINYAYQNEAAMMRVESVLAKSIKGKTIFVLTLNPEQRSQPSSIMEMSINGYSADKIAELRARILLLNETPNIENKNDFSMINSLIEGYGNEVKIKKSIFPDLWKQQKTQSHLFLPHARLAAVYSLIMSHTVEHILELKLALMKGNVMSVKFRGQRKSSSINQEPAIIHFQGT